MENEALKSSGLPAGTNSEPTESEKRYEQGTAIDPFETNKDKEFSEAKHQGKDVANNDGSVLETLDTAFHDKPGRAEGESVSGSNKAGYYDERSYGKSDDAEELDARNQEES